MVKKEKTSYLHPPKRVVIDLSMKTPEFKKRNPSEIPDLSLENLGTEEAMKKLISFSQAVITSEFSFSFFLSFQSTKCTLS